LILGEWIAALDESSGELVYSEVIAFIDWAPTQRRQFIRLSTISGRVLTLTPTHLLPVEGRSNVFAAYVSPGDRVLVKHELVTSMHQHTSFKWDMVTEVRLVLEEGVYAPLTSEGTLLVNDVVASCYAIVDSQRIAHYAFMPFRFWKSVISSLKRLTKLINSLSSNLSSGAYTKATSGTKTLSKNSYKKDEGIHWYASLLYSISSYMLPKSMLYD
jgi:hedgehog protein